MKEVYIIAGPNGSGKTTFAEEWIQEVSLPFLNADNIAKAIHPAGDLQKVRLEAGRLFFREFFNLIEGGQSFAVETTLSGKYFQSMIKRLKERQYKIFCNRSQLFLKKP